MQNKNTAIYIIGAGAIGKALAVFLKQQGKDVVLLRGHVTGIPEHVESMQVELNNAEIMQADILVSSIDNYPTLDGIIVLATKSYGNEKIALGLQGKTGNSPIVIMQNGLNVELPFIDNGFQHIYRCVLFTSSQSNENNRLRFKPAASSPIGIITGDNETLAMIVDRLTNPQLVFEAEENIQSITWSKSIINCAFNSICPLLETDNGVFCRNEKALHLAKEVIDECIVVAAAKGILLNRDKITERLLLISKSSDGQLISTYQDIINKRQTEISTFNFAISGMAEALNKSELTTRTNMLGELIQLKSEIAMQKPAII